LAYSKITEEEEEIMKDICNCPNCQNCECESCECENCECENCGCGE